MAKIAPGEHRILIVDDNSPDGTGKLADELAQELDVVEVLHRTSKDGLGRAYIAGFEHALEGGAELVVEMDADFSHDPKYLGDLISAAEDADLVLGSRYVPGGAVRNWGVVRKLISRGGSLYARTVLGIKVRDLTGGFKCIRRPVLETIDLQQPARRRLCVPDRGHLPRDPLAAFDVTRGADHVHGSRCRRQQDVVA